MSAAILLAAGESTRMGRPKALLPWAGSTLIEYQVAELAAAGVHEIVIVLGHEAEAVRPSVPDRARVVVNEAYREGRASSLRAGASALRDAADPIVLLNIDQPRPRHVIAELLAAHLAGDAPITMPVHDGRHGHPVVLSGALLPELRAATEGAAGLRGVIAQHADEARDVPIADPIVLLDINTPEEYEAALARFAPQE